MNVAVIASIEHRRRLWLTLLLLVLLVGLLLLVLPRALATGDPLPAPVITPSPPSPAASAEALFAFEGEGRLECALDGVVFEPCESPIRYRRLAPGVGGELPLAVSNPNSFPIEVRALTVTVAAGSSRPSCDGPTNLLVRQPGSGGAIRLRVPVGGRIVLPSQGVAAPAVRMRDLGSNQDACMNVRFGLLYDGAAVKARP